MEWIYLYQDMNDVCKFISSEKPDEWQTLLYYDFLKMLTPFDIQNRNDFEYTFSFIGKVIFLNILTGEWEEIELSSKSSFEELLNLNSPEEKQVSPAEYIKNKHKEFIGYFYDKTNNFRF